MKMAVLKDNGGIIIDVSSVIPTETFQWVFEHFSPETQQKGHEVLLFSEKRPEKEAIYFDYFIAAVKGASLIKDTFEVMSSTIMSGNLSLPLLKEAASINKAMNSIIVDKMCQNIITSFLRFKSSEIYRVKAVSVNNELFRSKECASDFMAILKDKRVTYEQLCGKPQKMIVVPDLHYRTLLEDELEN